jgi:hypothetical protein
MIISQPNDGRGLLYHIVNLLGQTVHAYRDLDAVILSREGDQRICIQIEASGRWLTDVPAPLVPVNGGPYRADLARADRLLSADELRDKYTTAKDCGEHPQYRRFDWRHEVNSDSTVRGYWDWVAAQLEEEE